VIACIPAFNEEKVIANLISDVSKYVDSVVVCDDGSADDTANVSKKSDAFVIKHDKNMGKGAALKSLFDFARHSNADIIITIDGDGQFLPKEIPKLIQPIKEKKYDLVLGNRLHSGNKIPTYRKFGNKVLDKVTNLAADLPFEDTQGGFRAYSKNAIEKIQFDTDGFGADSEILIDSAQKGLKITEEKVTVLYNIGTKTSTKNPISHSGGVVASLIETIAIKHPLKYLAIPGFILVILGIFFAILVISTFNDHGYFSIPSTVISVGFLIIGSMLSLISILLYSNARLVKN